MRVEERTQAALVALAEFGGQHRPGLSRSMVSLVAGQLGDVPQQRALICEGQIANIPRRAMGIIAGSAAGVVSSSAPWVISHARNTGARGTRCRG